MKKRLMLLIVTVCSFTIVFAQYEEKFSPSTMQFLSEQKGEVVLPKANQRVQMKLDIPDSPVSTENDPVFSQKRYNKRRIAEAETFNGESMISAFIGVKNNDFSGVEALGVVLQSKFNNLAVALIPVDKIEALAALDNVTKIEVAEVLETVNDMQRSVTTAGDAITNSAAAQALGLTKQYTGKNIILGVIDTGIDFQHIAFKDKNGNSRIVRAYKLSGTNSTSLTTYSSASQISGLTYDTNTEDHGTHTSTTAGGSSVIVSGSTVTVTDDHANATYGGMAPEANLVIAGLSSLYTTSIGTAIQNICNYADEVGKPCVISLSLGSQTGPHDGTGTIADIVNQCAGNNHIIVYAASNDGMRANAFVEMGTSNGGGMYASGVSTSSKPMIVNVQRSFSNADGNVEMLMPTITAYARTPNVATSLKLHVVNVNTGAVVYSSNAYTASTTIDVTGTTGIAQYFKSSSSYSNQYGDAGKIRLVRTQDTSNNKYYWQIYCPIMLSTSYDDSDGDGVYNSQYAFCVSVYPTSTGTSTTIDMWEDYASWFGTDLNLSGNSYNYCPGNDECSVSDNACYPKVISVGAYVTKNQITDYAGTTHDFSSEYPNIGDHASFSSWQTEGYGPLGTPLPHINAPGARIVAGINHYHTASVDDYSYYGDDYKTDLVVNSTNYPYAAMEGTSMATPCVSGIIAQWLEACVEKSITPTPDYIKEVMAATWDTDQWTSGTGSGAHGAKTFGTHGKINAIKGLQYILGVSGGPTIKANPASIDFADQNPYATLTYTKTVNVKGLNLEGNISATLTDANGVYSISQSSISQSAAADGVDITITYSPLAAGTHNATLTLSSSGADNVVVNITATAQPAVPTIMAEDQNEEEITSMSFEGMLNESKSQTFRVTGMFLNDDVTVTLNDPSNVFTVSTTLVPSASTMNSSSTISVSNGDAIDVTVTFNSAIEGTFNGSVVLSSTGATSVTINLAAKSEDVGKASDSYLNIAKYATIDDAGWRTALVDNLYKYTEYKSNGYAWLTLPLYGAFVGARYATNSSTVGSGQPQAWIECSLGTSNTYGGTTWANTASASSPFSGSSAYFTTATARAIGYNSRTNTSIRTVSFYVTNTTQVMLSGTGRSGASSSYPASMKIYECTKNTDGTVTASTTTAQNKTNSGTSAFTLTSDALDETKIYKVETSIYRGYLYEIAFKTPLPSDPELTVNPSSLALSANAGKTDTKSFTVTGINLTGNVTATLSDANGVFSIDKTSIAQTGGNVNSTVNVTFSPSQAGIYTGSVTLSSEGATSVTVSLNGVVTEPELVVDPTTLSLSTYAGSTTTDVFGILGENLNGAVTLTLNDANNVFSLSSNTATKAEAEAGKNFTVTFAPQTSGTYNATITVSTEGLADQTVSLTGVAEKAYIDVTIGRYGLTTLYTDIPLEIPYDDYDDLLGVYYATSYTTGDNGEIRLKRIRQYIPALTGVIIQGNSGTFRFANAKTSVDPISGNILQGTLEPIATSSVDGTVMTLQMGNAGYVGFYRFSGSTLAAGKVYVVIPNGQIKSMNTMNITFGEADMEETTGISGVKDESEANWYTLDGRKLNSTPTTRGLYIMNGQKVIVK